MNKYDLVHELKDVKLVLGNGFDLFCGLNTKYADFFESQKAKYGSIIEWRDQFHDVDSYLRKDIANSDGCWLEPKNFKSLNVWDLLFCFASWDNKDVKNWRWCDIEAEMQHWLTGDKTDEDWSMVFSIINGESTRKPSDGYIRLLAAFLKKRYGIKRLSSKAPFYEILLMELKLFEKNFGEYIVSQLVPFTERQFGLCNTYQSYSNKAKLAVEKLCSIDNISNIDTFNYDEPKIDQLQCGFNHVNGDFHNPIFGIDSESFPAEDPRFIFTKTYRRMELDMEQREEADESKFKNVIIFGHSLNAADFSYFFSVFDKIKITDLEVDSRVVFAYSVYDESQREKIMATLRDGIAYMFQEYSKYKNGPDHGNRLLDQLTTQRKVIMFDIGGSH